MTGVRAAILLAVVAWLAALLVLFVGLRPNVAHTLQHLLRDMSDSLPVLTTWFAFPALGISSRPLFVLVWAVLFGGPVIIGVQAIRLPEQRLVRFHVAAVTLYVALVGFIAVLVLAGIFLPFALL